MTGWLQSLRLGAHSATFARNDISGAVLFDVDQSALKEMGISSVGDRIRIFAAIKNLKKRCAEAEAVNRMHIQQQQGEMEYLDNDVSRLPDSTSPTASSRRIGVSRPPPLHLAQSAQDNMPVTPTHPSPQAPYSSQGLGLREARGLTSAGQGRVGNIPSTGLNRSPASMHRQLVDDGVGHRKTSSIGTPPSASSLQPQRLLQHQHPINDQRLTYGIRPSTAIGASGRLDSPSSSSSPTGSAFPRPSTSDGGRATGAAQTVTGVPLTPISEAFTPSSSRLQTSSNGYAVGRGALGQQGSRPITPSQASSLANPLAAYSSLGDSNRSAALSLEDVKRRTIKFIGEDGTTRIVPVSDCRDAFDVLARVLKKFGKSAAGNSYTPTAGQSTAEEEGLLTGSDEFGDLWGIFATSGEGQSE